MFLEIIHERYKQASVAFVANSKAMQAVCKPGGPHLLTAEQLVLQWKGADLSIIVNLEISPSISSQRSSWTMRRGRSKTILGLPAVSHWTRMTIWRSAWSDLPRQRV